MQEPDFQAAAKTVVADISYDRQPTSQWIVVTLQATDDLESCIRAAVIDEDDFAYGLERSQGELTQDTLNCARHVESRDDNQE
jgi:hypothetical protein